MSEIGKVYSKLMRNVLEACAAVFTYGAGEGRAEARQEAICTMVRYTMKHGRALAEEGLI